MRPGRAARSSVPGGVHMAESHGSPAVLARTRQCPQCRSQISRCENTCFDAGFQVTEFCGSSWAKAAYFDIKQAQTLRGTRVGLSEAATTCPTTMYPDTDLEVVSTRPVFLEVCQRS
eukprot:2668747-Rhodomonas_salina.2